MATGDIGRNINLPTGPLYVNPAAEAAAAQLLASGKGVIATPQILADIAAGKTISTAAKKAVTAVTKTSINGGLVTPGAVTPPVGVVPSLVALMSSQPLVLSGKGKTVSFNLACSAPGASQFYVDVSPPLSWPALIRSCMMLYISGFQTLQFCACYGSNPGLGLHDPVDEPLLNYMYSGGQSGGILLNQGVPLEIFGAPIYQQLNFYIDTVGQSLVAVVSNTFGQAFNLFVAFECLEVIPPALGG